jgi:hypothetical protein
LSWQNSSLLKKVYPLSFPVAVHSVCRRAARQYTEEPDALTGTSGSVGDGGRKLPSSTRPKFDFQQMR